MNAKNVVQDGFNNKLVYSFPNSISFPDHEIAIQSVNMYYSWTNINGTTLRNNSYAFSWPDVAGVYQVIITMPDGIYEIRDINAYMQFVMIQNGWYVSTPLGNVFFAEWLVNPTEYAIQLNTYPVWTAEQIALAGGVIGTPSSASGIGWGTPDNTCPIISMFSFLDPNQTPLSNFYNIIGYSPTFYSTVGATENQSFLSIVAPQVQPNPIIYLSLSNIENKYANPGTIIGSVSPSVAFGELISEVPPQFAWNKLLPGTYNNLRLALLGSDFRAIDLLDGNMTIVLVIRDRKDISLGDAIAQLEAQK
jgi:hypothetical protein